MINIAENSSRDSDSLPDDHLVFVQEDILNLESPNLSTIHLFSDYLSQMDDCSGFDYFRKLSTNLKYDFRLIGEGEKEGDKAFCYVLMEMGIKENKYYPHLNTLIKEQFFIPDMFQEFEEEQQRKIRGICQTYFAQDWREHKIQEYLNENKLFLQAFTHIFDKICPSNALKDNKIMSLSKKFNLDCELTYINNSQCILYSMGKKTKTFIVQEKNIFFVATKKYSKSEEENEHLGESERQIQDKNHCLVSQMSESNTPKFNENSESFMHRKMSHKNSFGGDQETINYNDLMMSKKKKNDMFSQRFQNKKNSLKLTNLKLNLMKGSHFTQNKSEDIEDKGNLISSTIINSASKEQVKEKKLDDENEQLMAMEEQRERKTRIPFRQNEESKNKQEQKEKNQGQSQFLSFSQKSKIKNRKFSYLIHHKKQFNHENGRILKKSFDAIPQAEAPILKIASQNNLRQQKQQNYSENPNFSQIMNQDSELSRNSVIRSSKRKSVTKQEKLAQQSNVCNFVKNNISIQPTDWVVKETTYYFSNKPPIKQKTEKKVTPIIPNIQKLPTNIRSTIDTHIVSNNSNMKSNSFNKIDEFAKNRGNPEKYLEQKDKTIFNSSNLMRDKSIASIDVTEYRQNTNSRSNGGVKIKFNFVSPEPTKNLTSVSSNHNLKQENKKSVQNALPQNLSLKTLWG